MSVIGSIFYLKIFEFRKFLFFSLYEGYIKKLFNLFYSSPSYFFFAIYFIGYKTYE